MNNENFDDFDTHQHSDEMIPDHFDEREDWRASRNDEPTIHELEDQLEDELEDELEDGDWREGEPDEDEDPDFVNWQYELRHEDDDHDAEDFPF